MLMPNLKMLLGCARGEKQKGLIAFLIPLLLLSINKIMMNYQVNRHKGALREEFLAQVDPTQASHLRPCPSTKP